MLLVYVLLVAGFAGIFLLVRFWPFDDAPRCSCGKLGAFLRTDGGWECDDCADWRLNGKAPKASE